MRSCGRKHGRRCIHLRGVAPLVLVIDIWNQKALWLPLDEAPPLSVKLLRHHRARDEGSRRSGASQRVEHSEWTQNHKLLTNTKARYDLHASICKYTPVQGKERALVSLGARICVFHENQIFIWCQRLTQ